MVDEAVWKRQNEIAKEIEDLQRKITRNIDVTEHAKIVRRELKTQFPHIKFKVVSSRYAGGTSVYVYHCDVDLTEEQQIEIQSFVDKFEGYRGDLLDGRYNVGFEYNGERLCGASFCIYNHKWSRS